VRPTVEAKWLDFNQDIEGVFACPYLDIRGYVTTAMGCIIEPIELALVLPWKIGERDATREEIINDWTAINGRPALSTWAAKNQAVLTSIRLRSETIQELVTRRLRANYYYLRAHLMPQIDEFPADAQLGILSEAWAIGAAFDRAKPPRPSLIAACNARDWIAAEAHARLREDNNAGVVERNARQKICFSNAQLTQARALDPSWCWWPNRIPEEDDLKTLALKALELGIARGTEPPES